MHLRLRTGAAMLTGLVGSLGAVAAILASEWWLGVVLLIGTTAIVAWVILSIHRDRRAAAGRPAEADAELLAVDAASEGADLTTEPSRTPHAGKVGGVWLLRSPGEDDAVRLTVVDIEAPDQILGVRASGHVVRYEGEGDLLPRASTSIEDPAERPKRVIVEWRDGDGFHVEYFTPELRSG